MVSLIVFNFRRYNSALLWSTQKIASRLDCICQFFLWTDWIVAFANQTSPSFNNTQSYQYCAADARTSDLVPIIVGACLGGLVIIVLVAYLIGRVRAKRQGYNSV
ncbi:unnamed protein product [Meloidogyne enterolobii]|uniref:Uncharacterized protein n=1 Tax=Meloidogyne enterolobii TaxID=390850 RepID=A0ACB1B512_MELEN